MGMHINNKTISPTCRGTLKFIAENNLNGFLRNKDEYELTKMENEIVQKVIVEKFPYIIMYEQYYDIGDI